MVKLQLKTGQANFLAGITLSLFTPAGLLRRIAKWLHKTKPLLLNEHERVI